MAMHDFRASSEDQMSFYVVDDLKTMANLYRYDSVLNAITKFQEMDKSSLAAIGMHLDAHSELDLIHQRGGLPVLVKDFENIDKWKNNEVVQDVVDNLIAHLSVEHELDFGLLGDNRSSVVVEIDRYNNSALNDYFTNKILCPRDGQPLMSAIDEAHVLGHGWMSFGDVMQMVRDGEEKPNITRLNVNYVTKDGARGQVDISTHDFNLLREKTERVLDGKEKFFGLDVQISAAEKQKLGQPDASNHNKDLEI